MRILCDFLTIIGFLVKENERYALTADAKLFLSKNSPFYAGSIASFIANPEVMDRFRDVANLVRTGGCIDASHILVPENERWVDFARNMLPVVKPAAMAAAAIIAKFGRIEKVLDIAAGSGIFGISVGCLNPEAQIFAADWRNVLEVAKEILAFRFPPLIFVPPCQRQALKRLLHTARDEDFVDSFQLLLPHSELHRADHCGDVAG